MTAFKPSELELGRRKFRRKRTARSVLISLLSTLVFAAVIWFVVTSSPGWHDVKTTFFSPKYFKISLPLVWQGLLLNIKVLLVAAIGVAIFASLLAAARTLKGAVFFPLRALATGYVDLFRGVPFIIVIYLVGFGIPALNTKTQIAPEVLGTIALVVTYSSYVAEVLRSGIESVHPSQRMAARSLGFTHYQTLRMVVMPQAVRKVTPALMNDFVSMQKDVGLISVLGATDAIRAAQIEQASSYNFTSYIVAALLFVAMSWPLIRLTDWMSKRQQRREQIGGMV